MAEENDDELDVELEEDNEDLEDEAPEDDELDDDSDAEASEGSEDKDEDDEDDEDDVPTAGATTAAGDDDEDDDLNPDDVEADLNAILKDRIAAGDDEDEEDSAPQPTTVSGGRVAAKGDDEFTCTTCFMIHHPRQFGRPGNLSCPEGYDPCDGIAVVEAAIKRSRKG